MILSNPDSKEDQIRSDQADRRCATLAERHGAASARDVAAHERDRSALARDGAAAARDLEDHDRDAESASLVSFFGLRRARSDRARSAVHRIDAGEDRGRALGDRLLSAEDRAAAAEDRARATAEHEANEVDLVTGARRRGPGLANMQGEIDRACRGNGQLVAAYVDVDGLKAINDSKGHHAGDVMLRHLVDVLHSKLRSYEPVVRLGGDEFVCTIGGVTIGKVRERFDEITAELRSTPDQGSITVGFAELAPGDSPMDLIDRADSELVARRNTKRRARRTDI